MDQYLVISVRFLGDRFHGQSHEGRTSEWPPSPMRLFQAMLAGAKTRWSEQRADAFDWLERQPAPTLLSPPAAIGRELRSYVPNNNDPAINKRTAKLITPRLIEGPPVVDYVWQIPDSAREHATVLCGCAGQIRCLGWGIDMAVGRAFLAVEMPKEAGRIIYRPARSGSTLLRVPAPGTRTSLERTYAASLERFSTPGAFVIEQATKEFRTVAYACSPVRPHVTFRFVSDDDTPVPYHPREIKQLSGQLRRVVARTLTDARSVNPTLIDAMVLGHPKDSPRLSILPLPSIRRGGPVDGLIRRVIFAEPIGSDGLLVQAVRHSLPGQRLEFEGACSCPKAELDLVTGDDSVLRLYRAESRVWSSVTPVLLPGHNERRQQRRNHTRAIARAQALIARALEHAGITQTVTIELDRVPYWPGSLHARSYVPHDKLTHLPRFHVQLRFASPVAGPLSIGAGRHVGFGLLAAMNEE